MQTSAWRFYPWIIAAGMSVVIAVNIGMVSFALHTFPGKASGGEGFDLSNRYNAVIERSQEQAALGWTIDAKTDETGHPALSLTDASGKALTGARINATAERPVGEARRTRLAFHETTPGHYASDVALPLPGQWIVLLNASADSHDVAATRRVLVR